MGDTGIGTRQRRFDTILSIDMVYRYDTFQNIAKHKFLFKERIMSTFLGLMLLVLAATTSPALENNLSDGTDVPQVPGTHKIHHVS